MTIDIRWHNEENNIVVIKFHMDWNWDEVYEIVDHTDALLNTVKHRVDFIVDLSQVRSLNWGMSVRRFHETIKHYHPNAGSTVVYGVAPSILHIVRTVVRTANSSDIVTFVYNEKEALALIDAKCAEKSSTSS